MIRVAVEGVPSSMRSLKSPLYSNCVILSPDGSMLCRAGERRMNWYLQKGLAEKTSDDPPTIKLLFEPAGGGDSDDEYMLARKENVCVVCGAADDLTRHHVVPYSYRVHFPEFRKSHSSYDVLPLCIACHEKYEVKARQFRKEVLDELKVQEDGEGIKVDMRAVKAIKSANAILKHGRRIPAEKMASLRSYLAQYYGKTEITDEDIAAAAQLQWQIVPPDYACASRKVVESIADIDEFAKRWREHFVRETNPQYMPKYWDANKKIYGKRGQE